jgi:hypothetical protein
MGRKKTKKKSKGVLVGVLLKIVLAIILAGGLIGLLSQIGDQASEQVADDPRYAVRIEEILVEAPGKMDRAAFLTEVRYLANLPEQISLADPQTPERLRSAFRLHPWVRTVADVTIRPEGTITVKLEFRKPVLAFRPTPDSEQRVLDQEGVLLPLSTPVDALPRYRNSVPQPGKTGELCPDADARRAVELVQAHATLEIEKRAGVWLITQPNGRRLTISAP